MAEVSVWNCAATRGKAGRYMSTAKGDTRLSAPRISMINLSDNLHTSVFFEAKIVGMCAAAKKIHCSRQSVPLISFRVSL